MSYENKISRTSGTGYFIIAEEARFELAVPCDTPVFKTGALNHYATPPRIFTLLQNLYHEWWTEPEPERAQEQSLRSAYPHGTTRGIRAREYRVRLR